MGINIKSVVTDAKTGEKTLEAVGTHYDGATGERIETGVVQVERVVWDREQGTLLVSFSLGGVDGAGKYSRAAHYKTSRYCFSRQYTKDLWDKHDLDNGPSLADVEALLVEDKAAISTVCRQNWGLPRITANMEAATKEDVEVEIVP